MSDHTVVRTFHIESDLDRRMDEVAFQSSRRWTKTKLVNRALTELLLKPEFNSVPERKPLLKPSQKGKQSDHAR